MRFPALILITALAARSALAVGTPISGSLDDMHLVKALSPYAVTNDIYVTPGHSLIIDAGVVLRFYPRRGLYVDGSLEVDGTSSQKVVFTADQGVLAAGNWSGVGFGTGLSGATSGTPGGASGILNSLIVQYAGVPGSFPVPYQTAQTAAIFAYDSDLDVENTSCIVNGGDGIYWYNDDPKGHALTATGLTLQNQTNDGIDLGYVTAADQINIQNNMIAGNGGYAMQVDPSGLGRTGTGNTFAGNGLGDGIAVTEGPLIENVTLPPDTTYFLQGPLTVPGAADAGTKLTLTVSPGDMVCVSSATKLQVNGGLVVNGTTDDPATFTADTDTPSAGYWSGIGFAKGASGSLTNAVVQYAGHSNAFSVPGVSGFRSASIFAYQTDLSIAASTISDSGGDGLYWYNSGTGSVARSISVTGSTVNATATDGVSVGADTSTDTILVDSNTFTNIGRYPVNLPARRLGTATNNTVAGNTFPAVATFGGTMDRSISLQPGGSYLAAAPVTVASGQTLSLGAGLSFIFNTGAYLDVSGMLTTPAPTGAAVFLTSSAVSPAPGAWGGLGLESGASANLTNVTVQYAGQSGAFIVSGFGGRQTGVLVNRAALTATNLKVEYSAGDGVFTYNAATPNRAVSLTGGDENFNAGDGIHVQRSVAGDSISLSGIQTWSNAGYGVNVAAAGGTLAISNVNANSNTKYPIRIPPSNLASLSAATFTGNTAGDAIDLFAGTIPASFTDPYNLFLEGNIVVAGGTVLTLNPGVNVTAGAGVLLQVNGALNAQGTAASPIAFRAAGTSKWGGIAFLPPGVAMTASRLDHVSVQDAGAISTSLDSSFPTAAGSILCSQSDLSVTNSSITGSSSDGIVLLDDSAATAHTVTLTDNTITGSGGIGIDLLACNAGSTLSFARNTITGGTGAAMALLARSLFGLGTGSVFSGNAGGDGIVVNGVSGSTATLARNASIPASTTLFVRATPTVASSATLSVAAGVVMRMAANTGLIVAGSLNTAGTSPNPVTFTADSASPAPGVWTGLAFNAGSSGTLAGLDVRYGGAAMTLPTVGSVSASLAAVGANVGLFGGLLRDGSGSLVYLRGTGLNFNAANTTLVDNATGSHVRLVDDGGVGTRTFGGTTPVGCDFLGLQSDAVVNSGSTVLNAAWNYWDAPDGPHPPGSGAGVQGNVNVTPFVSHAVNAPMAVISSPTMVLVRGINTISGTAFAQYFASAVLEVGSGANPSTFTTLATFTSPVQSGTLATWDTTNLPYGTYTLRLTVTDRLGRTAQVLDTLAPVPGDVDGSGIVDFADVALALQIAGGLATATPNQVSAGDVRPKPGTYGPYGDGQIQLDDALAIAQKAANPALALP